MKIGPWLSLSVAAWTSAQGAVQFNFTFSDASTGVGFDDPVLGASRQASLTTAANRLGAYLTAYTATVDLTVSSQNVNTTTLGTGSSPVSGLNGFMQTRVQQEILTGVDVNGANADGTLTFNFFHDWSYGDTVAAGTYDFQAVAMHEVMHAMGFFTFVQATGQGARSQPSGSQDTWSSFDQFLTTSGGASLVTGDFRYDTAVGTGVLTGNPGVFFSGANAMAAYGNRVPLYSPSPFLAGSSLAHVDQLVSEGVAYLMNPSLTTGPGPRSLNQVEIAILKDIGYAAAVPEPGSWGMAGAMGLLAFAGWRHRREGVR